MVSVLNQRSAGLLVHPTSLPGPHAAGDIGLSSRQFVDFLHESGLSWWQMLPIHPTGACGSPYDSPSAFAGGEHLISVDDLVDAGLLDDDELEDITQVEHGRIAILDKAQTGREELLRRAFRRFEESPGGQLHLGMDEFIAQNREWVIDYATFIALRQALPGSSWVDWPEKLRLRDPQALEAAREEHKAEIRYRVFAQFVFHRQWARLRRYAAERGVQLMGDMPMFVSHDSVDVWANQDKFFLNGDGGRAMQAGVPPDYFSEDGQLWGNPLYRWDRMKDDGFTWWIARLKNELIKFDAVRLDHFIAFSRYWEVPMDAETAKEGRYINVPGHEFFEAAQHSLGRLPFVAEDLGLVTEEVEHLRDRFELPGMKVMHFGFATGAHSHLPHCHPHNSIAYLGTHDNDTTRGWLDERRLASERGKHELDAELGRIQDYVGGRPGASLERKCIASLLSSGAHVAILTPQDLLEEGTEHRMNVPGQAAGNWEYRLPIGALNKQLAREVRPLLEESGRVLQTLEQTA